MLVEVHENETKKRAPAKRRDSARTRAAILRAAQVAFASRGYADVGLREVAFAAGFDKALVARYFGSKELLFRAALEASIKLTAMLQGDRKSFGARTVEHFLNVPYSEPSPLKIMVLATADPAARAVALELLETNLLAPMAAWIGGEDSAIRAVRVTLICSGFLTYLSLLPAKAFSEGVDKDTRKWLGSLLQQVVDDAVATAASSGLDT